MEKAASESGDKGKKGGTKTLKNASFSESNEVGQHSWKALITKWAEKGQV
jgi:hypothetical protein